MRMVFEGAGFNRGWALEDDKISILKRDQSVKDTIPLSAITSVDNWHDTLGGGQIRIWHKKNGKSEYVVFAYKKDQTTLAMAAEEYLKENYGNGIGKIVYRERRMRCRVCGKLYCFTKDDLDRNAKNARSAAISGAASGLAAIGGTRIDMYGQAAMAESALGKIVDYSRCPNCNSTDVEELTEEQYKAAISENATPKTSPQISAADEIRKFKELLDSGIISKEEFDAKKKQLLGL